jgi:hypothetical protein
LPWKACGGLKTVKLGVFVFLLECRRDKTLNYFSIMLRKRLKNSDGTEEPGEGEETEKGKKSARSLVKQSLINMLLVIFENDANICRSYSTSLWFIPFM